MNGWERIMRRSSAALLFLVPIFSSPAWPASPADDVDPLIGGVAPFLRPTYPTVHQPNQMLRTYPIKRDYLDDQIDSFPLQVLRHRGNGVLQMRFAVDPVDASTWKRRMSIDHDLETVRPWFYQTELIDDGITVAFAPGRKGMIYRIEFPDQRVKNILISGSGDLQFEPLGPNRFAIEEKYFYQSERNPARPPSVMPIFVYGEIVDSVDRPIEGIVMTATGGDVRVTLGPDLPADLFFKYTLSYISGEQARENFENEIAGKSLESLSAEARAAWELVLNQITVTGGTESQRRSFYSALYRAHERPVDINESGRYYSGYDETVHASDRPFYVDDGIWYTYRALHPLRTILNPRQEEDMLNSLTQMSVQAGDWMPTYARPWGNHPCMVGYHTSATFLDAHRKGLGRFDIAAAYAGIRNNLTEGTWIPWRQGAPRTPLDEHARTFGYMPSLHPGEVETEALVDAFERRQPVPVTLSRSFDSWALAELADDLGRTEDARTFRPRSRDYQTLWHPDHRLFMPKDKNGDWVDIDPKLAGGQGFRDFFDENNGWTYGWLVQHDIPGLIDLLGGPEAAIERLDQLFREPLGTSKHLFHANGPDSTGMVGQFVMGNEIGFHIPYLYNYFGAPWKTQQRVRFLLNTWFQDTVFGNPGDEDGGAMAAWVVLSSIGLYQVTPGIPVFTITSPVFPEVIISLPDDRKFTISAPQASRRNKYIQRATLNGEPLETPFLRYDEIMAGGHLTLHLAERPSSSAWKSSENLGTP